METMKTKFRIVCIAFWISSQFTLGYMDVAARWFGYFEMLKTAVEFIQEQTEPKPAPKHHPIKD